MYIVELALKHTALPLSVQKSDATEANRAYSQVMEAIKRGDAGVIELACDKQPNKKVAVIVSELAAVQVYEKSGTTASGRAPGFFAMTGE